jgi:hypothetical protein
MKQSLIIVLISITTHIHAQDLKTFFLGSDRFFKKHVSNGLVDYHAIKNAPKEIESLYKDVAEMTLTTATAAEKKAFYINAYNIVVIYYVSTHYPLRSPLDQSGFFDKVKHTIAGEQMTLNALEIKKLLQTYKDARVHFVLACAAKSCPPLASFAYMPEQLDKLLTDRTVTALNNKEWLKIYPGQKRVELSKIFEWYKNDFITNGKSQLDWINEFRKEKIPVGWSIEYYEYNWLLNEK